MQVNAPQGGESGVGKTGSVKSGAAEYCGVDMIAFEL